MNAWQAARQLKALLQAATWPDAGGERVFGTVAVSQATSEQVLGNARLPLALVRFGGGAPDAQEPRLVRESVEVVVLVAVPGDAIGEAAMIGAARAGGSTSSAGRGLLEVEEVLLSVAAQLGGANGLRLRLCAKGRGLAQQDDVHSYTVARGYVFEGWIGSERSYPAPVNLVAEASGAGNVALTWSLPPSRFDRLQVVLRRAAGDVAPSSPTDGTGVALAGALSTSVADTPGAGTFSYALFAGYDETSQAPTATDRWSDAVTREGVLVT